MRPDRRALVLIAGWLAVALAAAFVPGLVQFAVGVGVLAVAAALVDLLRVLRTPEIEGTRTVAAALAVRRTADVGLALTCAGAAFDLHVDVFDHHPATGTPEGLPRSIVLPAGQKLEMSYRFRPLERGVASFGLIELLIRSPWGLWQARRMAGARQASRVYPDFRSVHRYAILAVDNAVSRVGVRRRQRRGSGMELQHLREYRDGDALRQVDWKATSRRSRMIAREYEDERNQQLFFLLDCGRNMRAADRGVPHFDDALNSVLLLTYVALRQGDAVGLMTMGGPDRWLRPVKGPGGLTTMLNAVHDLETGLHSPDFTTAATTLMTRQRRRALVVVVTNLRDEDGDEITAAVRLMRTRHLVLLASLREAVLDEVLAGPIRDFDDALDVAALHHYLGSRRTHLEQVSGRGTFTVDVAPGALHLALVNRYLDIKRRGAL